MIQRIGRKQKTSLGFSLVELLIVIAIIGVLAAVVMTNYSRARQLSKTSKAQADLKQLHTGMEQLALDTGKWPNGCIPDQTDNPEVDLNQPAAGLISVPPVGLINGSCEWKDEEVAKWNGPYVQLSGALDPWGTAYYFDPDYRLGTDIFPALVSWGPDKLVNTYTSDDIYIRLR